jgi:hypothetical protein
MTSVNIQSDSIAVKLSVGGEFFIVASDNFIVY